MKPKGTYVYCLVAAARRPSLRNKPAGLAGTGRLRLLEDLTQQKQTGLRRWLVVADAPLDRFGEEAINRRLRDLDWVSHAAVRHEAVVESFVAAPALLPMKLFTIFRNDDRALAHVAERRDQVRALLKRVTHHDEWGLRVVLDRERAVAPGPRPRAARLTGAGYLARKRALRDSSKALAGRSRAVVRRLYDRLAAFASESRRRGAHELPAAGGPLLMDAAFLVDRARRSRFRAALAREARRLDARGYRITVTGPWPPYSFLE